MNTFALTVTAIDRVWFQGTALACAAKTSTGWRTFEARHEPFVAVIAGPVDVTDGNGARFSFSAREGLLLFDGGACVVVVSGSVALDKS